MTTEHNTSRVWPLHVARLLIAAAMVSNGSTPLSARAQGDPPPPRPTRDLEAPTTPWVANERSGAADTSSTPDGVQSAAGRLAFQSIRDGNWEIYFGSDDPFVAPTRLTADPAADVQPRISPDVSRIVFTSRRSGNYDLWLMNVDGSGLRQLTNDPATDSAPTWSPDGTRIAFASGRGGNTDVYVMNADGSGVTRLTTNTDYDGEPAWSPDGTQIAFISRRSAGGADYFLYTMNAQGGAQALRSPVAYSSRPNWSPDGTRILFDGAAAGGWVRPYLYTLAGGATQLLQPASGIYVPNYDLWAGGWGQDAEAYTTLVTYVLVDSTWYIESMKLYRLATDLNVASEATGQLYDANPDWRNADRLPPISYLLPSNPYKPAYAGAGLSLTVNAVDQGIAGIDHFDVQSRPENGSWQTASLSCMGSGPAYGCWMMPPLQNLDIRVRAVDRMGNAEPWPTNPDQWARVRPYLLTVTGQVTDLRANPLVQVPIAGAPAYDAPIASGLDGRYRLYVPNQTTPLTFTVTAALADGTAGAPRTFVVDGPPQPPVLPQANHDLVLRPADQLFADPDFVLTTGGWAATGLLQPQWLPASSYPTVEPARMRLGLQDGRRDLSGAASNALSAVTDDGIVMTYRVDGQGIVFQRCDVDAPCGAREVIGGDVGLALGVAPDGTVAFLQRTGPVTVGVRFRSPAGTWSASQAFPHADGDTFQLLASPDNAWHLVWGDSANTLKLSHRNGDGTWTAATTVGMPAYGARAVFDGSGRLHLARCEEVGVQVNTWTSGEGLSAAIPIATLGCDSAGLMRTAVDESGRVYVAWKTGNQILARRRSVSGVWSELPIYYGNDYSIDGLVMDRSGRPAGILVDYQAGLGGPLRLAALAANDTWTTTDLTLRHPAPNAWQAYLGYDAAVGRLLVERHETNSYPDTHIAELMVGVGQGSAGLTQTVSLSAQMHRPTLAYTFRHEDPTATLTLTAQPVGGGAPVTQTLSSGAGWQHGWLDLTALAGQSITISFSLQAAPGAWPVVDFDSVALGSWTTPLITAVTPAQIDLANGTLTLTGDNIMGTPIVTIGGVPTTVSVVDAQHLTVTVPPTLGVGHYPVVVANPNGAATVAAQSLQIGRGLVFLPTMQRLIPGGWVVLYP